MEPDLASCPVAPLCLFCGELERIELFEIWSSHEFSIETCCEGLYDTITREMADDPAWARSLLQQLGIEEVTGYRLRRLADDGCCGMVLDWHLRLRGCAASPSRPRGASSRGTIRIVARPLRGGSAKVFATAPP